MCFQIDTLFASGGLSKNSLFIQEHADIIGLSLSPSLSLLNPSLFHAYPVEVVLTRLPMGQIWALFLSLMSQTD